MVAKRENGVRIRLRLPLVKAGRKILDADGVVLCESLDDYDGAGIAAAIVASVNQHQTLLAACVQFLDALSELQDDV